MGPLSSQRRHLTSVMDVWPTLRLRDIHVGATSAIRPYVLATSASDVGHGRMADVGPTSHKCRRNVGHTFMTRRQMPTLGGHRAHEQNDVGPMSDKVVGPTKPFTSARRHADVSVLSGMDLPYTFLNTKTPEINSNSYICFTFF